MLAGHHYLVTVFHAPHHSMRGPIVYHWSIHLHPIQASLVAVEMEVVEEGAAEAGLEPGVTQKGRHPVAEVLGQVALGQDEPAVPVESPYCCVVAGVSCEVLK